MRRGIATFAVLFILGASGFATAGILAGGGSPPAAPPGQDVEAGLNEQQAGVHGGPIERFHEAGSCELAEVSSLPGNWTHGDYVSAVAAGGNPALIRQAAQSDCGKPMVAAGHGGGPPAHALQHMAAGRAHAVGKHGAAPRASGS